MAAMAAVRFAARRLTGQQAQAILRPAVAKQQGVLNRGGSPASALRRFTSSEASASASAPASKGPRINTEHPSVSGDSSMRAARRKKEELFDLLTEIQMNKNIPRASKKDDRLLLQRLTSHVDPRPSDAEWRKYIQEERFIKWLLRSMLVCSFLYMVEKWGLFFAWKKGVQPADSNSKASASFAEQNTET